MDLNLLVTLDHLLREVSVTETARRMGLSASAVSRALDRLRETTGDPLLVRAGRRLVLTARAEAMRERVEQVVEDAQTTLRGGAEVPAEGPARTFVIRSSDLAAALTAPLAAKIHADAPRIRLCFISEGDSDEEALRDGRIHLELGDLEIKAPEMRVRRLFRDRWVGVVRKGHPLSKGNVTKRRFAAHAHVGLRRAGPSALERALRAHRIERDVPLILPNHHAAIAVAAQSDFVAVVPEYLVEHVMPTLGVHIFRLPFEVPPLVVSQAWHPRFDADPTHRWLRTRVQEVCSSLER